MNCRQCQALLDDLLVAEPTPAQQAELTRHAEVCPACARQHELANEALAAITPTPPLPLSADFKERVMHAISAARVSPSEPIRIRVSHVRAWRTLAIVAAAAVLLVALLPFFRSGPGRNEGGMGGRFAAFGLLSEACAAEGKLFAGNQIVHLLNEIIVTPTSDPTLAKLRWLPLMSLEANGKQRFDQLALPAEMGQGYTVEDQSWYDPPTGRFARILTTGGGPIFANSFDGSNVYCLEPAAAGGAPQVVKHPISKDFQRPQSPADFLGLGAGLRSALDAKNSNSVRDMGKTTLDGGVEARVLRLCSAQGGPKQAKEHYWQVTIRSADNIIEKQEWLVEGQPLLVVRRGKAGKDEAPSMGWDLSQMAPQAAGAVATPGPGIRPDMVISNVSVEHMVKKADFATYIFSKDPPWAGDRMITDCLDLPSPPHRMFLIAYRANDGRHVVLDQAHTFNMAMSEAAKSGKLVYTSPSGVKVWSGPHDQWMAQLLLKSAQGANIPDPPGKELTGYLLETPAGTFPALAVNGKLSDEELHALIDSLVPAKEEGKKEAQKQ